LYGPPIFRPDLLVVGRNPGFNAADLYDEEILTWPKDNDYANKNWKLAAKLRSIFSAANLETLLERSLGTNRLFFKSKGLGKHKTGLGWADNSPEVREQLEVYCAHEVGELVRLLEPKLVLALGLSVFDATASTAHRDIRSVKGRRLAAVGEAGGTKIVGIIHPTGARVSNEDWAVVANALALELDGNDKILPIAETAAQVPSAKHRTDTHNPTRSRSARQPALRPDTVVRATGKPPGTFGYQPIHDFWQELSQLGEVTVEDFHQYMVSTGWRRPQGGALRYEVTRTDIACMCREGFAVRVGS